MLCHGPEKAEAAIAIGRNVTTTVEQSRSTPSCD
jgi:hypothetical protein